jgi:hypothetical protein
MSLGGDIPLCSFCAEAVPVTIGDRGAAICERCAEEIFKLMTREQPSPGPLDVDPRDPRPPIEVGLARRPIGDLGNTRVDARLLLAIALRDGQAAAWLRERGLDEAAIRGRFGELELGWE